MTQNPPYLHYEHLPERHRPYYLGWCEGNDAISIPDHMPDDAVEEETTQQAVHYQDTPEYQNTIDPHLTEIAESTGRDKAFLEELFIHGFTHSLKYAFEGWIPILAVQSEFEELYGAEFSSNLRTGNSQPPSATLFVEGVSEHHARNWSVERVQGLLAEELATHSLMSELEIGDSNDTPRFSVVLPQNPR